MQLDDSFELSIALTEREHGRDPHENTFEITVEGSHVTYEGPYGEGERGRYATETVEFDLTDDQRTKLRRQIETYDLLQSVSDSYEAADVTADRDVEARATIGVGDDSYTLDVEGPTSIREAPSVDWEYREQARGLKALCYEFKPWAEDAGSTWWNPFGT